MTKNYNPNQPRVSAGHPTGGQWTSDGSSAGNSARDAAGLKSPRENEVDAAARKNMYELEKVIKDQSFETAGVYGYDSENLLFWKDGTKDEVMFSQEELGQLFKGRMTHNHPSGNCFSNEDILMFETGGLREIRAATKDKIFIMSRWSDYYENDWKGAQNAQNLFMDAYKKAHNITSTKFNNGEISMAKGDRYLWESHWREYANLRGFYFIVADWKDLK